MSKKEIVGIGFDNLSTNDFIQSITEDTGAVRPAEESPSVITADPTDALANTILASAAAKEQAAAVIADKNDGIVLDDEPKAPEPVVVKKDTVAKDDKQAKKTTTSKKEGIVVEEKDKSKKADPKAEAKNDGDAEPEFVASLDDDEAPVIADKNEGDSSWKKVAKEGFGIDMDTEDFQEFKEKVLAMRQLDLSKYKPETQRLAKFTEAGGNIEDFMEPLGKIDALIYGDKASLVDQHLKLTGFTDDAKRSAKMERLIADEEIDIVHEQVVNNLKSLREEKKQSIINEKIAAQEAYDLRLKDSFKNEAKEIGKALSATKDYFGTPLEDKHREKIIKKYELGAYEEDFKNPEVLADFLLYREYGKKAKSNFVITTENKLRKEFLSDRHKVPPAPSASGSIVVKPTITGKSVEGNFDALENERIEQKDEN